MDGRVIREGFGMIMTLVLDKLDLRCLWGYPSGDVEQASGVQVWSSEEWSGSKYR